MIWTAMAAPHWRLRRQLAAAAYAHTAAYDAAIASWFAAQEHETFPERLTISGERRQMLRYGENPHQQAAFYVNAERPGVATARQAQGKELSYNNLNDTDAAFECVAELDGPAVAIIKHANPCGVAVASTLTEAWELALRCDPVSAFGGIVAVNRTLDAATAERISAIFTEVIIAPDADQRALDILARKKNLRLLLTGGLPDPAAPGLAFRSLSGGFLAQTRDAGRVELIRAEGCHAARSNRNRACRPDLRVPRLQTRKIQRDCLRKRWRYGRHRRRPDEPRQFRAHRRVEKRRGGTPGRTDRASGAWQCRCVRCVLSLRRRAGGCRRCGRNRCHPARRLHARCRGHRRSRQSGDRDGADRHAPLPTLTAPPPLCHREAREAGRGDPARTAPNQCLELRFRTQYDFGNPSTRSAR